MVSIAQAMQLVEMIKANQGFQLPYLTKRKNIFFLYRKFLKYCLQNPKEGSSNPKNAQLYSS